MYVKSALFVMCMSFSSLYRFFQQGHHFQGHRSKTVCLGDSILRNLEENILEFNPEYDIDVHVNPGVRVNNLKDKLRSDFETFEFETAFVLLHVGQIIFREDCGK